MNRKTTSYRILINLIFNLTHSQVFIIKIINSFQSFLSEFSRFVREGN